MNLSELLETTKQKAETSEFNKAYYVEVLEALESLEKENQELKRKYDDLMLDFKMFDFNTLKQKNEKLKKAIEIIKDKTKIRIVVLQGQYHILQGLGNFESAIFVSEGKGRLLKEVLE